MKKIALTVLLLTSVISNAYAYEIIEETSSYTRIQCESGSKYTLKESSKGWRISASIGEYFSSFHKAAKYACSE